MTIPTAPEDDERLAAVARLGAAGRTLSEAVVRTEVGTAELLRAAEALESATTALRHQARGVRDVPGVERLDGAGRVYSPVDGAGHPGSFPVSWERDPDGTARGLVHLGARFEGPPGLLHGGLIAALFDQVLGVAVVAAGLHALTGRLSVSYHRAVPLDRDVLLTGRLVRSEGRKHTVTGTLALADEPDTVMARGDAVFVTPSPPRSDEYFGGLRRSDGTVVDFAGVRGSTAE